VSVARRAIRNYSSSHKSRVFELDEISDLIERSLSLDPSLDNPSWSLKASLIDLKYKYDKKLSKNRRDELEDIIL
ncbi:hypothetical protein D6V28_18705, partial [Vibrio cholerae]|nr:hypothetical protein [Vibrio cholerae]